MYDVTQARPIRHEAARVHTTYTRDQLLSLYTPRRPTAAVTARLRSFNLYTVCRLHVQRRRPHRLYDRPVVGCYCGCRAGRICRRPAIVRPTGYGAGILVGNCPSRHVATRPTATAAVALVAHLGARRQTSFFTTRHSWRRRLCSASSSTAPTTCKQRRVCCTQHSTAASLSPWRWKCEIEYHTDTHLASYGIVMPCPEVWRLERPVAVIYQSRQSVD